MPDATLLPNGKVIVMNGAGVSPCPNRSLLLLPTVHVLPS